MPEEEKKKPTEPDIPESDSGDVPEEKRKTGIIPRPKPRGATSQLAEGGEDAEPLTSDTISIKRPLLEKKKEDVKDASKTDEEPPEKEEESRILKIFCHNCGQKLDMTQLEPFSKIECPACNAEIIVPSWFDNYLLEEKSGIGGMAVVYRALDLALDREAAIKVLDPEVASDTQRRNLFLHEARTAATINHYGVLPIYTCGEFENKPYIVMQWMEGGALEDLLKNDSGPIEVEKAAKWMKDVTEGLDNANRHGIIHHDVKPGNIMLDGDGNAKIGDFGIAQAIHDAESEAISHLIANWASPDYVSPEKALTGKEDHKGDIYSLGATFYHLLTGDPPFKAENHKELIKARLEKDPKAPNELRKEIPDKLSDLIVGMMARSPELRPGYRDISSSLDDMLKNKSSQKGKTADKQAVPEKRMGKTLAVNGEHKSKLENIMKGLPTSRRVGILSKIKTACILIILFGGTYLAWKNGWIDNIVQSLNRVGEHDRIPEATDYFVGGVPDFALNEAEKSLNDTESDLATKKQAGVQVAFGNYLMRHENARQICNVLAERLSSFDVSEDDPAMMIVRYMGASAPDRAKLIKVMRRKDARWLQAAYMAVYLRGLYDKSSPAVIHDAAENYSEIAGRVNLSCWTNAWKGRISHWENWIGNGIGDYSFLEPLIRSVTPERRPEDAVPAQDTGDSAIYTPPGAGTEDSLPELSGINIGDLTASWLKEHRGFASDRPRPPDFDISLVMAAPYLGKLDSARRDSEKRRLSQIVGLKRYLCMMMMRNSYTGKELMLKNGNTLKGSVMANPKYISIKTDGKRRRIQWSNISPEQFAIFLHHYAQFRYKAAGGDSANSKQRYESAWEFLRTAIFCDWYGFYPQAVKLAKRAVALDSRLEKDVKQYIMN